MEGRPARISGCNRTREIRTGTHPGTAHAGILLPPPHRSSRVLPGNAIEFGGGRCSSLHLRLGRTHGSAGAIGKRIRDCARTLHWEGGIFEQYPANPQALEATSIQRGRPIPGPSRCSLVPRPQPLAAPWHEYVARHSGAGRTHASFPSAPASPGRVRPFRALPGHKKWPPAHQLAVGRRPTSCQDAPVVNDQVVETSGLSAASRIAVVPPVTRTV